MTVADAVDAGLSDREETASSVPRFEVEVDLGVGAAAETDKELVDVAEGGLDEPPTVLGPAAASAAGGEVIVPDGSIILIGTRRRLGAVAESADAAVGTPGSSGVFPLAFCLFNLEIGFYTHRKSEDIRTFAFSSCIRAVTFFSSSRAETFAGSTRKTADKSG